MKTGIQVSSFRPVLTTAEEVCLAFDRIRAMDCRVVQLQWIHPAVPVEVISRGLDRAGLVSVSVQNLYAEVAAEPEYYLRLNQLTGGKWLCVSRIPEERKSIPGLEIFAGELAMMQKELDRWDQRLCFHPVAADLQEIDGVNPVEYLMEKLPWLELCLDLYHVNRAGLSMTGWLRRWAGRVRMVHFKDFKRLPDGTEVLVPAGQGDTDWTEVPQACVEAGVEFAFVEQERWDRDPFECLGEALRWLDGFFVR